jgi:hypothetical protein
VGRTSFTPSNLALFARPAPPARGLDRMSLARRGLLKQIRQGGSEYASISTRTATAASAILLAKMQREIPGMARKRKSRTRNVTAQDSLPDDLYDYARPPARRVGRPALENTTAWTVTDDWPDEVPITEAEIDVFEAWFGDLFDELFSTRH